MTGTNPYGRRQFFVALVSWLFVTCAGSSSAPRPEFASLESSPDESRPNVVLILADDLGYGDLRCYGHDRFRTPHLDQMASEGIRFTNFYVPVPYCAPTRGSLLTGRYPFRTSVWTNPSPDTGKNDVGLPSSEQTLAEALKASGYATAHIGKWHLGHKPEFYPIHHGFDEYFGILYSNDMRPVQLIDGDKVVEYPVVQANLTKRYTERSLRFIEANRHRSFFLYLAHAMPHKPLAASEDFYRKTGTGLYGDVVSEVDWSVGQILQKLEALDLDRRTLVIFLSDNGPWYGGSTAGLRGMKGMVWEGGIRVPMIVRWPGKIPKGQTRTQMAGAIDIFPTILGICTVDSPANPVDGKNLLPLWMGMESSSPHEAVFFMKGDRLMGLRAGRWKLLVEQPLGKFNRGDDWVDPRAPDGVTILAPYEQARPSDFPGVLTGVAPESMMLFDLAADPAEQQDVAERYPAVVERLRRLFDPVQREADALLSSTTRYGQE